MKLFIATDHRGVDFKKSIIERLKDEYDFVDLSPENFPTDDHPDFAFKVGEAVRNNDGAMGVLVCSNGVGMCIDANKVKGIRCALVYSEEVARACRREDDPNVISLGSNMDIERACECIRIFTSTGFCDSEEKYVRRRKKVIDYENGEYNEL